MKLTKWWAWFFLTERAVGEKGGTGGTGKVKTVFRRLESITAGLPELGCLQDRNPSRHRESNASTSVKKPRLRFRTKKLDTLEIVRGRRQMTEGDMPWRI